MGAENDAPAQVANHAPPPPPHYYTALATPSFNLGLQKLASLDQVRLKQISEMFGTKYKVITSNEELIFNVKEDASTLAIELGGKDRAFKIDFFDEREQLAISLQRDLKLFKKKKMQVFVGQELVSKVRLKRAFFGRLLHINDFNDQTTLTLSGSLARFGKYKFDLLTLDKRCIGSITRLWRGLGNELFSDAEEYQISFPMDLDFRYKAAVIGACVLIDIHYYSNYIQDSIL